MSSNENKLHNGHRARMRERVQNGGLQALADHELLEMLLYYTQPRRDTNETAHELIEECGSLSLVLEAPVEKLCRVHSVGEGSALYLKLLGELSRRYAMSKLKSEKNPMQVQYDSKEKLASYLYPRFFGRRTEQLLALLFDNSMHMLDCFCAGEGSVNSVQVSVRAIAQRAYARNASCVILAHNHPDGIASPSAEDIRLTRDLYNALSLLDITLAEHLVFAEKSYFPIMENYFNTEEQNAQAVAAQSHRPPPAAKK